MEINEYRGLEERERAYFWNVGRREILREALRRNLLTMPSDILDVGCGTGGNMLLLRDFGSVTGVDFSPEALKFAGNAGFKSLMLGDATRLNMPDMSFDLVTALDVLEHIPNDAAAISEAWRVLKPGGIFLVTVPSYQWLWSQHDEVLRHVRRYNQKDLLGKLRAAGFVVLATSHFVMLAVIVNLARKLKDKIFGTAGTAPHGYDVVFSGPVNSVLLFLLRCEKFLMRYIPLPFGTSIMVVARKAGLENRSRKN